MTRETERYREGEIDRQRETKRERERERERETWFKSFVRVNFDSEDFGLSSKRFSI